MLINARDAARWWGVVAGTLPLAVAATAGPLTPPAGPVAPTPGPEPRVAINATNTPGDADSLFKITQPGSYYLTGNITGVANKHGIEIDSSGVTLDLNGFDLVGTQGMGSFDAVTVTQFSLSNITVRNGSIRNWGSNAVDLGTFASANSVIEDIRARGNADDGIKAGASSIVRSCVSSSNGGSGITLGVGSTVSECIASSNGVHGIRVFSDSVVAGNSCFDNGLSTNGAGIQVTSDDNRVEGNNCIRNGRGVDVTATGNIIIRNTCSGNGVNWVIVANNVVGPILDRTAPGSAAINGNSAPDSTGSSHPNANFSY